MHRFTTFVKGSSSQSQPSSSSDTLDDEKASTIIPDSALPPPVLKYKRLDYYYSKWGKQWKYKNMSSTVSVEERPPSKQGDRDPWKEFCFVFVRTVPKSDDQFHTPTYKLVVKSEYILKACKDVVQTWPGVSWNSEPLELDPEILLTFYPGFVSYRDDLQAKKDKTEEETHVLASVEILLEWIHSEYRTTLATIKNHFAHKEISFEHLYALMVPRSILVAKCAVTGDVRAFKLESFSHTSCDGVPVYRLVCHSVDLVDRPTTNTVAVGRVQTIVLIPYFKGTVKIDTLSAFPIQYHVSEAKLRESLVVRGRKWLSLTGSAKHVQYKGLAALKVTDKVIKHDVTGRVMLDRITFKRLKPNYSFPSPIPKPTTQVANAGLHRSDSFGAITPPPPPPLPLPSDGKQVIQTQSDSKEPTIDVELQDEDFLLAPTVLHGFSLSDKLWLEFNVEKIQDVEWNENAFDNLVIPSGRKNLLRSLVEAHHKEVKFDDFIKGKGQGLVINLFGPPGVGKTFSAEATSEHVKQPLYVVGAGDLGTRATDLEENLGRVFDMATTWKAIVLIDEADVFLEQRSLHDLERNAMVAVFLRHIEYFRGILFLTTNRVKVFDEAFLSRIHLALYFDMLSQSSKAQVWRAFLLKIGAKLTEPQIQDLALRNVNGRQIKNTARTAQSLAAGRGEAIEYEHLVETLDTMNEFNTQFDTVRTLYS